jgi:hypothetical protein
MGRSADGSVCRWAGTPGPRQFCGWTPVRLAEALTHATLRVLAERLSAGEAEDLQAQLGREFSTIIEAAG